MNDSLLSIQGLSVVIRRECGEKRLLEEVDFQVSSDSIVALVGASGSGKTTMGLAILRLLPEAMRVSKGKVLWQGQDLLTLSEEAMRRKRGKEIAMIFQEPLNAFDPVFPVGYQIAEVLQEHTALTAAARQQRVLELLADVEIEHPERVARQYPHQLSGGMRQRAMIAQAIAASPALVIADEPTSNLDVTIQAKIMELFRKLRRQRKISMLLISHDLGMVKELADHVVVLADGRPIESGKVSEVLERPRHPFTEKILQASLL